MRDLMIKQKIEGNVLVVDDEPAVRTVHKRVLEKYHLPVLTAQDGREALEIFIREPHIPVIVTDINMPRMNGFELIMEVVKRKPRTQIIVITAFLDDTLALYGVKSNVVCLPKPVEPEFVVIATIACYLRFLEQQWQHELKNAMLSEPVDEKVIMEIINKAPWMTT